VCKHCTSEMHRRQHIRRRCIKMGLSEFEAEQIANKMTINCEICGVLVGKSFHIDHCHRTGRYRGLLCANCNSGIGLLGDDPERLGAAMRYLKNFEMAH